MAHRAFLWRRTSNKVFYATLFDEAGKKRYISLDTKDKQQAEARFHALTSPQIPAPDVVQPSSYTLSSIQKILPSLCSDLSRNTIDNCYKVALESLRGTLGDVDFKQLTPVLIEKWKTSLMVRRSPVSINIWLRHMKALGNRLLNLGVVPDNPFKKVRSVRVPDQPPLYFEVEQVQKVIDRIEHPSIKGIVLGLLATGCRAGELTNLRWEQVNVEARSFSVLRTKTRKPRALPINDSFLEWLKAREKKDGFVFPRNDGSCFSVSYVSHRFKKTLLSLGMNPKLHLHSLRHSTASLLVKQGIPIFSVSKLLGHTNIRTTMVYSHLEPSSLVDEVNLLSFKHCK